MTKLESVRLRRMLDYWSERRQGGALPARADIDPLDFAELLANTILVDVEGDRLRVRLAGTGVVERFGEDYTGRYLDEIDFGAQSEIVVAHYWDCVRTAEPHASRTLFTSVHRTQTEMERLILPLSEDGTTVTMMLACIEFRDAAAQSGED